MLGRVEVAIHYIKLEKNHSRCTGREYEKRSISWMGAKRVLIKMRNLDLVLIRKLYVLY